MAQGPLDLAIGLFANPCSELKECFQEKEQKRERRRKGATGKPLPFTSSRFLFPSCPQRLPERELQNSHSEGCWGLPAAEPHGGAGRGVCVQKHRGRGAPLTPL